MSSTTVYFNTYGTGIGAGNSVLENSVLSAATVGIESRGEDQMAKILFSSSSKSSSFTRFGNGSPNDEVEN